MSPVHALQRVAWTVACVALGGALPAATTVGSAQSLCVQPSGGVFAVNGVVAPGATLGSCMANTVWSKMVPYSLAQSATTANGNFLATGTVSFSSTVGHLYVGLTVADDEDLSDRDAVMLAFDRNNNGWDVDDFILELSVDTAGWGSKGFTIPMLTPNGRDTCDVPLVLRYYRRGASSFSLDETINVSTHVTARMSWDYETAHDPAPDINLWNVEIDIQTAVVNQSGHSYFGITTDSFAIAAYVFAELGHAVSGREGMVLKWPDGIPDKDIDDRNLNSLAATALKDMKFGTRCFDVNVSVAVPLTSNAMTEVNKTGPTHFRAWYYFDGPGDAVTAGPNTGDVWLRIYRYTASTSWQQIWSDTKHPTVATYNDAHVADFDMAIAGGTQATDFCSDLKVQNWQFDDDRSDGSNLIHINYIPFATSEVVKEVDLPVDGIPGLSPGATTSLLLHVSTSNDARPGPVGYNDGGPAPGRAAVFILAGVACLGVAGVLRRRREVAGLLALMGVAAIVNGCRPGDGRGGGIKTERWNLANAQELGLTPIQGEPGWYRMPARQGELKRARFQFTGRPLPYRTVTDSLSMKLDANGRPRMTRIPARPGQVVTVIALGTVDPDGPDGPLAATNANGLPRALSNVAVTNVAANVVYPLGRGRYVPGQNVGTLVASADGFRTSFVVGTNASFVVPRGAEGVTLAINGATTDYARAVGGFVIKWIVTDAPSVPTKIAYGFDTPADLPKFIRGWDVLTSVHLVTFYEAPFKHHGTGQTLTARVRLGEAHMSVYESH